MDGVPVPGVHGGGAGGARTTTLLLEEGRPIGVDLAAHREGGADRQVCVLFLGSRIHEAPEVKGRGVLRREEEVCDPLAGVQQPPEVGSLGDTAAPPR